MPISINTPFWSIIRSALSEPKPVNDVLRLLPTGIEKLSEAALVPPSRSDLPRHSLLRRIRKTLSTRDQKVVRIPDIEWEIAGSKRRG